jgi:hypothetical protein
MELFLRNGGECADRVMKMDYPLEVGFKADLILKMEIGNVAFLPFLAGVAKWKSEALKLCPRFFE